MEILPPVLDLSTLQRLLAANGEMKELESKIRLSLTTQSCLADLRQAESSFAALIKLLASARGWRSPERGATEAALLAASVTLYIRATVTQAARRPGALNERGPIDLQHAFTAEQLLDHKALKAVRSEAMAHVHIDHPIDGLAWHSAATIAICTPDGWMPGAASRRVQLDIATVKRLERLLPVAIKAMTERSHARLAEVTHALEKSAGDRLDHLLGQCWLDPIAFFGSHQAAARALNGAQKGQWIVFEGS